MPLTKVAVVMAGGSGERFWPLSRKTRPKQLLHLTSPDETMLEDAVNRLLPVIPRENIHIASNRMLMDAIREAMPAHPPGNVLGEPLKRNTTGCLAYAAAHLLAKFGDGDAAVAVTTADHLVGDPEKFETALRAALDFAAANDALVTMGIKPSRPETGYGYIEVPEDRQPAGEHHGLPVYKVIQFLEKPGRERAAEYIRTRRFYWNSGMFFWRLSVFLDSMRAAMPEVARTIRRMADILRDSPGDEAAIEAEFGKLPNLSIDYALMEKADNVYVVPGRFPWDDVGSWDAFARLRQSDGRGNTVHGGPVLIDCANTTVYNHPGEDKMAVCVVGMEDVNVVVCEDGVLVCHKDRAQDVRRAVDELKKRGAKQL